MVRLVSYNIFRLIILEIRLLKVTMVYTQGLLKLVCWIGLLVFGRLREMIIGVTLLIVVLKETFMAFWLGEFSKLIFDSFVFTGV